MRCLYCRKKIGWLRRQFDRQYCSAEHRRRREARSARALRDAGEMEPIGLWTPRTDIDEQRRARTGARSGAFAALLICGLMLILLWTAPQERAMATAVASYSLAESGVKNSLRSLLPGWDAVHLRDDFQADLRDWIGSAGAMTDWNREADVVRPGKLRIWGPSLRLTDYNFEFEGQVERKSMSWAFRSNNLNNYYATKLSLGKAGSARRAELIHYVVIDGKEYDRVQFPLPLTVLDESRYHIKVNVKGAYFVTSINGRIVDSWNDRRLKRGGVGFFSDKDEAAAIHWVTVDTVEPGFFSRLFASALLVPPGL